MKYLKRFNEEIGNPKLMKCNNFYKKYKNIVDFKEDDYEQGEEPTKTDLLSEIGDLCNELDMSKANVKWVLDNYDCSFDIDSLLKITHDEWVNDEELSKENRISNEIIDAIDILSNYNSPFDIDVFDSIDKINNMTQEEINEFYESVSSNRRENNSDEENFMLDMIKRFNLKK
jgi:hypothetical protein